MLQSPVTSSRWRRSDHAQRAACRAGRRWLQLATIGVVALAATAATASVAYAYRRADAAQVRAIRAALGRHTTFDCGTRGRVRVSHANISTADRRYAIASCGVRGHFGNLLRRPNPRSERWVAVFSLGDGAQPCSAVRRHVPESVIRDFRIGGLNRAGNAVRC